MPANISRWLRRYRPLVILLFAAATVGVLRLDYVRGFIPLEKIEQALIDFRFLLRGNVPGNPDCVTIGINTSSLDPSSFDRADVSKSEALQLMQQQYPWNRKVHALLIDKLMAAGARVVVFDLIFMQPNDGDADFAAALHRYQSHVVIGSTFQYENPGSIDSRLLYKTPEAALVSGVKEQITGCVTIPKELDKVIRRTWYLTSALEQYGYPGQAPDITSMAGLAAWKFDPRITLPEGTHSINFQGPSTTYIHYPIEELFIDRIYNGPKYQGGRIFKDKLVFVGPIADFFQDWHVTPYGSMPGVEIHAQIAGSLLSGNTLKDVPGWMELALCIPMALLAALASARLTHPLGLSGALAIMLLLFMAIAQWAFMEERMLIPMEAPLAAYAATGLFGLIFNFFIERLDKARIRSVLDTYVSSSVAALVLKESDEFEQALRGQRRSVTVLFSDIRGFTTMTEAAVPEQLVEQLNEYFYRMVEELFAAEGTLQQFVGDAIMAVWGNTYHLEPALGARQAVKTALVMRTALAELNKTWAANPQRRQLNIGIGVNHGEVIVGSLGHPQRMEYTTIGDGINTAARLETATKQFGCTVLIGEAVESLTRQWFHYRRVGSVQFKGKLKTIEAFTPLGESDSPCPAWLERYHAAVALYRERSFSDALAAFDAVRVEIGGEDRLCEMYIDRCREFLGNPPDASWDGAWTLTEK
jgi:adenylate cyclase